MANDCSKQVRGDMEYIAEASVISAATWFMIPDLKWYHFIMMALVFALAFGLVVWERRTV